MSGLPRQRLVGPFPPPTGGVAVAALTVSRALEGAGIVVERFDTSTHSHREDIYRARGAGAVLRNCGLLARLAHWALGRGAGDAVYHVFVTSDRAFVRDQAFLRLLRAARRRIVVHLHSKTAGEYYVDPGRLPGFGRALALGARVVVLSDAHRDFFARYVPAEKLCVLENFVIAADFAAGSAPAGRMLYLSRISEMKGAWEAVRAAKRLAEDHPELPFTLTVAGTADTPRTQAELDAFVVESGLSGRVSFVGHVEGAAKKELFRTHGVFVFPSRFENSPITLKEATQAGLAVVASDIAANRSILDRCGNAVYHERGDGISLAERLADVLGDPALYGRLRAASRDCAKYDESYAIPVLRSLAVAARD
jgi:glycosyltransferase involved in cell wall biosynthesis